MPLPPGEQIDPTKTPIAVNPSGAPPNFDDPPSLARTVFAIGLTLVIFSAIFVALRLFVNFRITRKLGLADRASNFTEKNFCLRSWLMIYLRSLSFRIYFNDMLLWFGG